LFSFFLLLNYENIHSDDDDDTLSPKVTEIFLLNFTSDVTTFYLYFLAPRSLAISEKRENCARIIVVYTRTCLLHFDKTKIFVIPLDTHLATPRGSLVVLVYF